jgi:hypothetical protein
MTEQPRFNDADGMAALGICESLLLALTDLLTDVAAAHSEAASATQTPEKHEAVVEIVQRILAGKNGVRH